MKDEETIQAVAFYLIEGHTIHETANKFGVTDRTIQNYMKELNKEDSKFYNKKLYDKVRLNQKLMQLQKAKEGGKIGKRGPSQSEFDMEEIARIMIEERLSLSMASKYFNVPISTIYDNLLRLDDEYLTNELKVLFEDNKIKNRFHGNHHSK